MSAPASDDVSARSSAEKAAIRGDAGDDAVEIDRMFGELFQTEQGGSGLLVPPPQLRVSPKAISEGSGAGGSRMSKWFLPSGDGDNRGSC